MNAYVASLLLLLGSVQSPLESAEALLAAGKLREAQVRLEAAPAGPARNLLEVRILEAAGRYGAASQLGLEFAEALPSAEGGRAMQLEFYAAKAALWDRRGERALAAVEAMEARLGQQPPPAWLAPSLEAWRGITDRYRAQAEELLQTRADLSDHERRARWSVLGMGLAALLVIVALARGLGRGPTNT